MDVPARTTWESIPHLHPCTDRLHPSNQIDEQEITQSAGLSRGRYLAKAVLGEGPAPPGAGSHKGPWTSRGCVPLMAEGAVDLHGRRPVLVHGRQSSLAGQGRWGARGESGAVQVGGEIGEGGWAPEGMRCRELSAKVLKQPTSSTSPWMRILWL